VIGPYLIACCLLVLAGAAKTIRPANTVRALSAAIGWRRVVGVAVPVLAAAELALGVVGFLWPVPALAMAIAVSYLVFAGFVVLISMRHGALSSCGCFGTPDTPATWLHAAINMFLAASALVVALDRPGADIVSVLRAQPWRGIPMLAAVGVGTWLVVLAFSTMAQLSAVRRTLVRRVEGSPP